MSVTGGGVTVITSAAIVLNVNVDREVDVVHGDVACLLQVRLLLTLLTAGGLVDCFSGSLATAGSLRFSGIERINSTYIFRGHSTSYNEC